MGNHLPAQGDGVIEGLELWSAAQPGGGHTGPLFPEPDDDEDAPPAFTLRPYQEDAVEKTMHGFYVERRRKLLGVAATGAGKTAMFCTIAKKIADSTPAKPKTLILTDQYDLVEQTVRAVRKTTGMIADMEQAENRASRNATVVVATVQTLKARLANWPPDHFDLVVADECDRAISVTWQTVIGHFAGHAKLLGVTATPKRADKRSVLRFFEHKAFEISMLDLIHLGYLSPVVPRTVRLPIDLRDVRKTAGDLDASEVAAALEKVFEAIAQSLKEHATGRRTIVFLPLVETSKRFADVCNRAGLRARHIDGGMPKQDRRFIKQAFRDGQFDILCNPMLLGRGYDDPGIDCVVCLRATQSEALYRQIIGRGTRLFCPHGCNRKCDHPEAKQNLLILDYLWQFDDHGPLRPGSLIAENPEEAAAITKIYETRDQDLGDMDIEEALAEAKATMERSLLERFISGRNPRKVPLRADVWAAKIGERTWVGWEPETDEQAKPITGQQAKLLTEKGFAIETVKSSYHADFIIRKIKEQTRAGLASYKQAFWLWNRGIHHAHKLTMRAASAKLGEFFGTRD